MLTSYSEKQSLHFSLKKKKWSKNNKITLFEGRNVLTDDPKIAETFNSFFGNIVNTLHIGKDESTICDTGDEADLLLRAIKNIADILSF